MTTETQQTVTLFMTKLELLEAQIRLLDARVAALQELHYDSAVDSKHRELASLAAACASFILLAAALWWSFRLIGRSLSSAQPLNAQLGSGKFSIKNKGTRHESSSKSVDAESKSHQSSQSGSDENSPSNTELLNRLLNLAGRKKLKSTASDSDVPHLIALKVPTTALLGRDVSLGNEGSEGAGQGVEQPRTEVYLSTSMGPHGQDAGLLESLRLTERTYSRQDMPACLSGINDRDELTVLQGETNHEPVVQGYLETVLRLANAHTTSEINGQKVNFWEAKNSDGVTVWGGDVEGSSWGMLKARTIMRSDIKDIADTVFDKDKQQILDDLCEQCELVQHMDSDTELRHSTYKAVWPTKPRDFVVLSARRVISPGEIVVVSTSVEHSDFPANTGGYVRGELMISGFYIRETAPMTAEVTMISWINLNGYIPAALLKRLALSTPIILLTQLRKASGA